MSSAVTACVRRIPSGLNTRDGATLGCFVPAGFATGPAWPICADAAAPSAWMASVSFRRPGPISGLSSVSWWPSVLPARVTAQYATVVMPDAAGGDAAMELHEIVGHHAAWACALRTWRP